MKKFKNSLSFLFLLFVSTLSAQVPTCQTKTLPNCNLVCFGDFEGLTNSNIDFLSTKTFSVFEQDFKNGRRNTPDLCFGTNKKAYPVAVNWANCNQVPQTVTHSSNFLHLSSIPSTQISAGTDEAFLLPLIEPLVAGVEYEITFKKFSRCTNAVLFDFTTVEPCLDVWKVYNNQVLSVDCAKGVFIKPQIIPVGYKGVNAWENLKTTFIADRAARYMIVRNDVGSFVNSSLYLDDIVIKPKAKGINIQINQITSCIGGKVEIEYSVCAKDNLTYKVDMQPDKKLPNGITFDSNGNFPNGNAATPFVLNGTNKCKTVKLTLNTINTLPLNFAFTVLMGLNVEDYCKNKTSITIPEIVELNGEDPKFDLSSITCNSLFGSLSYPSLPNTTHYWEVLHVASNKVIYSTTAPSFKIDPIGSGMYKIKHIYYFPCGSTTLTKDVNINCNEVCVCEPNNGFNINAKGQTVLLSETGLFKANPAIATGSCIYINGQLQIDKDYILDGANVKVAKNCGIWVMPNVKLTIKNKSLLEGCPLMWTGIIVREGGFLDITDSKIKDASTAIGLNKNVSVRIKNNEFAQNIVGIRFGGGQANNLATLNFINGEPITGNKFICGITATLKDPSTFPRSLSGIDVQNGILDIGKSGFPENKFIEMEEGIKLRNSDVTFTNCSFNGLFYSGIDVFENSKLNVSKSIFKDIPNAIIGRVQSSLKMINDITVTDCQVGIRADDISQIQLQNSKITVEQAGVRIWSLNPDATKISSIKNVTMTNSLISKFPPQGQGYSGIYIDNANFLNMPQAFLIEDVTINPHAINEFSHAKCTQLDNSKNVKILNMYNVASSPTIANPPSKIYQAGIYAYGSDKIRVKNHRFYGKGKSIYANVGVGLYETINSRVCCSTFDTDEGIQAYGAISNAYIRNNYFENESRLSCRAGTTELSVQKNPQNRWSIAPPNILPYNADHYAGSLVAKDPTYQQYIDGSRIEVGSSYYSTSEYWAKNAIFPKLINPGGQNPKDWFHYIPKPNVLFCSDDPQCSAPLFKSSNGNVGGGEFEEEVTRNDTMAARGFYKDAAYGNMMAWKTARFLYKKLSENIYLLDDNNVMDSFFNVTSNTNIAKLYAIEEGINNLNALTEEEKSELERLNDELDLSKEYIQLYNDEIANSAGNKDDITTFELLNKENQQKAIAAAERLAWVESEIEKKKQNKILQISEQNNSIVTDAAWEKNEQIVNDVLLHSVLVHKTFLSKEQAKQIADVAFQCELEGGRAVILAQGLYQLWENRIFKPEQYCTVATPTIIPPSIESSDSESKVAKQNSNLDINSFVISPNPASNDLAISIAQFEQDANYKLSIASFTGEVVLEKVLGTNADVIDIKELQSGVYFCNLLKNGKTIGLERLIVIK